MLYRVDLNLNPGKSIRLFRQQLVNKTNEVRNLSFPNITSSELIKQIRWIQKNSDRLIKDGIFDDSGNTGLIDFEVYANLRFVGARRLLITNDYEDKINSFPKMIDSKTTLKDSPLYISKETDIKQIVRDSKKRLRNTIANSNNTSAIVDIAIADVAIAE